MVKRLRSFNSLGRRFLPSHQATVSMFCILFIAFQLEAQTRTVSGKVASADDGTPLPGANVLVKGTTNGTTVAADGAYTLSAGSDDVLVFSFIGYASKEVSVGQQTNISVDLEADLTALQEVVVVGYGSVKKTDLTGSVSIVEAEELVKVPSNDVVQMMQGRVPGVAINSDGQPGASPNVRIRGISTFGTAGTSAEPLYVVDGLPLGGTTSTTADNAQPGSQISAIRDLNPNDIASITILKDASAAAIYGVRAANGVVIITTKKGKFNQALKVDINAYAGVQIISETIPVLHRAQYQEINRETFTNAGLNTSPPIPPGNDPNSPDFIDNIDTDWQKSGLKNGSIQNYNIGFSGGGDNTSYFASLDYFKNSGTLEGNGPSYDRTSVRLNTDTRRGNFRFGENLYVSRSSETSGLRVSGIPGANPPFINDLIWAAPTIPIKDPNREGGYGGSSSIENSLSLNIIGMNNLVDNKRIISRALIGTYAEYDFFKSLTYRLSLQYDYTHQNDELFVPEYDLGFFYPNGSAFFEKTLTTRTSGLIENTLVYKKILNKHNINVLGGVTFQAFDSDLMKGRTSGIQKPYVPTLSNGTGTKSISQYIDRSSIFSLLGRFDYNYDDRYFITANIRRDGSSKFSEANRYVVFPSVALAWKIHNDIEMPSFIRELKLRGGIGRLGNQSIPNYGSQPILNSNVTYSFNDVRVFGAAAIAAVDPNLRWEVRTTRNVGFDIALFKSLDFTVEYYNNTAEDIIVAVPLPLSQGAIPAEVITNGGAMKNTGIEMTLNFRKAFGELYIEVSPNFYTVKNEVTALGQGSAQLDNLGARTVLGGSLGRPYGWVYDGIFQTQSEVDDEATQSIDTGPGDIRFKDLNNDGIINDDDRTFLGDAIPNAYYGLNLTATYKNFDFTLFASGSSGAVAINNQYRGLMSSQSSGNTNYHEDILSRWTPDNTNTDVPRMIFLDPNLNGRASDRPGWIQNTSYLRLNTVSFGYSLPRPLLDKLHLAKARVYVTSQNLHTFTKYKGFNPDFQSISTLAPCFDFGTYPRPATYMAGLQISF